MSDALLIPLAIGELPAGATRGWVQLARSTDGVQSNGGKKFEITAADIDAYVADIRSNPDRIPIDYDHSFAERGDSRAAGWVEASTAEARDGENGTREAWAQVDWTPAAADAIRAGEYRYISPELTFAQRAKDGVMRKAAKFLAAALTNRPFFKDMAPVRLAEDHTTEGDSMSATLNKALGLAEDADENLVLAAIAERDAKITAAEAKATEAAEKLTATQSELDTLKATASDADKKVATLTEQVATLAREHHEAKRQALIDAAITGPEPKMLPAERDAMVDLYDAAGHDAIVKLLEARPAIKLNTGRGSGEDGPGEGDLTHKSGDPIDSASAELDAKVQAHLRSLKLDHAPTQDDYLRAVEHVQASA